MTIVSTSWGVLVARHQQTKLVAAELTSLGTEHFIPKIEILTIKHGRHYRELRPMLGDYILTSISVTWRSMRRVRGVVGIIMNSDGFPAQVLVPELRRMHEMCDDAGIYHSEIEGDKGFEYGQRVTPKAGPLAYQIGKYDSKNKRGDLSALFTLFGRDQKVTFKAGDLIAV